ncbi:alginate export family protein [Sphingomonas sp.]|uniref:alginate export family protein n=1 Tax=Sphingomonas sp. TaxID=28214 RepID=UPI001D308036|nr:alginate export family protein [Sphingomonas sp.]MBX9795626.1 alginate export family protein [Sphingomonas sp.]
MRALIIIAALAWSAPALGQMAPAPPEKFDLSLAIRLRHESITGQTRANLPASEESTQTRALLLATYRTRHFTIGAELIDSRAFAVPTPTAISTNEVNALEPLQAWVAYDFGAKGKWHGRVSLGRMTLDFASRRLLARDDYRNTLTSHTGIKLDLIAPFDLEGTFFYVLPNHRLPEDPAGIRANRIVFDEQGFETRMWGGRLFRHRLLGRTGAEATFLRFEERDSPIQITRDRHLSNIELRLVAPPAAGMVDFETEVIRQTGSIAPSFAPTPARLPVESWFVHGRVGYSFAGRWHGRVSVEADYASGNRAGSASYGRFDSLFGQRRGDFAPAGLMSAILRSNLIDIGPRIELQPAKWLDGFVEIKKMWLASATDGFASSGVVDATGASGRDAGWMVDGRVRLWLVPKNLRLDVEGTWIAKGRFLRTAPNRTSDADTGFLSLNLNLFL